MIIFTKYFFMSRFLNILIALLSVLIVSCANNGRNNHPRDLQEIIESDTLVVATLYGPISYFNYKESEMGYEYEFVKEFSKTPYGKIDYIKLKTNI